MASKKPWRTVLLSEETGRFTREQIDAAVMKAKQVREQKAAEAAARKRSSGSANQEA